MEECRERGAVRGVGRGKVFRSVAVSGPEIFFMPVQSERKFFSVVFRRRQLDLITLRKDWSIISDAFSRGGFEIASI
jgi:hypothetical protein